MDKRYESTVRNAACPKRHSLNTGRAAQRTQDMFNMSNQAKDKLPTKIPSANWANCSISHFGDLAYPNITRLAHSICLAMGSTCFKKHSIPSSNQYTKHGIHDEWHRHQSRNRQHSICAICLSTFSLFLHPPQY